jgi:hypothetical protein
VEDITSQDIAAKIEVYRRGEWKLLLILMF